MPTDDQIELDTLPISEDRWLRTTEAALYIGVDTETLGPRC